jgi:hypothetical protein
VEKIVLKSISSLPRSHKSILTKEQNAATYKSSAMTGSAVNQIENQFSKLPPATQLGVLERLVHQMRENLSFRDEEWESQLAAMASDPDMQRELAHAKSEFGTTENDGLGKS